MNHLEIYEKSCEKTDEERRYKHRPHPNHEPEKEALMATIPFTDEVWLKIADFPDYSISNYSRVRRDTPSLGKGGLSVPGMIMKPEAGKHGHLRVRLTKDGKYSRCLVYRLAAFAFGLPKRPDQKEIAHCDGDTSNNHISNLRWATRRENALDTIVHGTSLRGSKSPLSKKTGLNEEKVLRLRQMKAEGCSYAEIEKVFGVGSVTACAIVKRRNWRHI